EDGIRDLTETGVQTCALPICLSNKKTIRRATATMALPQLGRPEDMANACVFLASDRLARHITGQTLVIAGGMEGRWLWLPEELKIGRASCRERVRNGVADVRS